MPDRETQYIMLMASLPAQATLFGAKQTALSRLQLDRRLHMLSDEDADTLQRIEELLAWERLPPARAEAEIVADAGATLADLGDDDLHDLVLTALDLRTIVAALRRRHRGEDRPPPAGHLGPSRWLGRIDRNWHDPDFGLAGSLPWVLEAHRLMADGDARGLERHLLGQEWRDLGRLADTHSFDFVAVVAYVRRWTLVARWVGQDGPRAAARFDALTEAGLAGHTNLFAEAAP